MVAMAQRPQQRSQPAQLTLVGRRAAIGTARLVAWWRAAEAASGIVCLRWTAVLLRGRAAVLLWGRARTVLGGRGAAPGMHLVIHLRVANLLCVRLHHLQVEHNHHPAPRTGTKAGIGADRVSRRPRTGSSAACGAPNLPP